MSTTFQDPEDSESLKACYEILPRDEAQEIWDRCPLPFREWRPRKKDDDDGDNGELYIA